MKRLLFIIFFIPLILHGQDSGIDRLIDNELKMSFPSIYFKHNSTDYAKMPYTVDSCFKYIAFHIKDINDLVIWRDSFETEKLTNQPIKKLKTELHKYKVTGIYIESMGEKQKISKRTIEAGTDSTQNKYLLTLNSVFEIAKTRLQNKKNSMDTHGLWVFGTCWKHAFHLNKNGRERCRMSRRHTQATAKQK